jgi:hypothetical protein
MSAMQETMLFARDYERPADELWAAVKHAVSTMDLRNADDAERTVTFASGVSMTSWGQHLRANVHGEGTGSRLIVHGRAKHSLGTTRWGEDVHARGVEKQLTQAIDQALGSRAA